MMNSNLDFYKISQVLTNTIETMKEEHNLSTSALEQLQHAQNELQQAMSLSFSSVHKKIGY
ncbi:hypothetical protein F7731_01520 [Cytobacillus depressus]|uniref:Uncharacterized protein n=1 Tax=Cytobacillus depressus TaxID=1602942 RepID=A0A6L3VAQ3_9BACI|nr:hypothetical protein [Cytobacillus depressus]KAB2338272.1 hypothetical protein F7731_01520 [Cytobacillus depressus]